MKARKWPSLIIAAFTILSLGSCEDWGQMDPPAGSDVYPKLEQVLNLKFDGDRVNSEEIQTFAYSGGDVPSLVTDEKMGQVLCLDNGYARIFNPYNKVKVQNAVSLVFYVKQAGTAEMTDEDEIAAYTQDLTGALFSFENQNGTQRMFITANGWLSYEGEDGRYEANNPNSANTGLLTPDVWHYVALSVTNTGYFVYVDGKKRIEQNVTDFDFSKIVQFMASVPYIYMGYGSDTQTKKFYLDDVKFYRNTITSKEWTDPRKPDSGEDNTETYPEPVYIGDFDSNTHNCRIYGNGQFIDSNNPVFGKVFSNVGGAQRANYLILPQDALSHSTETGAMSIGVWVNRGNETDSNNYLWAPLFTAYASGPAETNGLPMLACQYRGVLQVNCNGWSDYIDAQNVAGVNTLYHGDLDWLADGKWHYYTATFTATTAKVYIDGVLKNAWEIDGTTNTAAGLFSNGADLKYICLGGNQAWDWGDNDPGFWFDDIAIYNEELTPKAINHIINKKKAVYFNDFELGADDTTIYGEGSFIDSKDDVFGKVFSNVGGAQRANYLILPQDALSHSTETGAMSIGVWVNRGNETDSNNYLWAPLFTAYASGPAETNGLPMLACQYRGVLQVNCNGWSDYIDAQNVAGVNTLYHGDLDWLADGKWHYYTATFTATTAKVYIDGVLKNAWEIDGTTNTAAGLFSNGADLKYICLGGNQAWDWGDNDPGFWFDDIAIFNTELTPTDISDIIALKK